MFCSQCGQSAEGKFCSNCGAPLNRPSLKPIAGTEPPDVNWEDVCDYAMLLRFPHVREAIEHSAAQAEKILSAEQFLELTKPFLSGGVPIDKLIPIVQPLYAKWGIATGKQRSETVNAPVGRVLLRALCSLARHGQALQGVQEAGDGCVLEAKLPSDFRSFEGELILAVRRRDAATDVSASTKINGQLYDWGKSRRCLDRLFADLQTDPAPLVFKRSA